MLTQALFLAASAAIASAQITYNGSTIICPANNPNGNFCAGTSLGTNIIIRCVNGVAGPGNCNDNLDGEPPVGLNPALCYQSSPTAGDAACSKNCIVYGATEFTLPNCTPYYTASSSSTSSSSSTGSSPTYSATSPTTTSTTTYPPTSPTTSPTTSSTTTSTGTTVITTGSSTITKTFTTTYCPPSSTGTGSSPPPPPPNNGTFHTTTSAPGSGGSPTNTPTGPSSTVGGFTGAAAPTLSPMGLLAGAGLVAAYFL
ncbi:hypothetical protein N431DRAFT_463359 [Stipitochalara longipes BDJ]|nr:hypothetical protein N431DRAFT_463359 [Stipitochalara longipes BDJ]